MLTLTYNEFSQICLLYATMFLIFQIQESISVEKYVIENLKYEMN